MGNSLRKIDLDNLSIDGGAVKSSEPAPQVTLTNGLRQRDPNAHDPKLVGKLIAKRKLAPFYEGKFDEPRDGMSGRLSRVSSRRRSVESGRAGAYARNNTTAKSKPSSSNTNSDKQGSVDKKWLTLGLLECPICLMVKPFPLNFADPFLVVSEEHECDQVLPEEHLHAVLCKYEEAEAGQRTHSVPLLPSLEPDSDIQASRCGKDQ